MKSHELRARFLKFFENRGHAILPSAPLIPENDPTVLFNTAGMQPLVPYHMGTPHPQGDKLANLQKCLRTNDIEDIGDKTHATFFEMMGNWSLGSYFKEEAIRWSFEFLTSKTEGLGLDKNRLYVTIFKGDANAPFDEEAKKIWMSVGMPEHRIYAKGADSNWWPAVKGKDTWTGPTGPCSEMFYDITEKGLGDLSYEEYCAADEKQQVVEIWNDVFMEFEKKDGTIVRKLDKKNVDTGAGFERLLAVIQKKDNIFDTDIFDFIKASIKKISDLEKFETNVKAYRIVADHMRAATMLISDGAVPSNSDQGYIVRRLIRRAIRYADILGITPNNLSEIIFSVAETYKDTYPEIINNIVDIKEVIAKEEEKFRKTLESGLKELRKVAVSNNEGIIQTQALDGKGLFNLYSKYGFPIEMSLEEVDRLFLESKGQTIPSDIKEIFIKNFELEKEKHQMLSRVGAEQKFKGGLGSTGEIETRYHTATHLLHQALRSVLGTHVQQKGSNITVERLRFDFTHPTKMTDEEKKKVEDLVNSYIAQKLTVHKVILPKAEAEASGALHFFGDKYGDSVSVYYIGDSLNTAVSKEFCGGPHVENTGTLGTFKIQKEEAVSAGVRRIKAILA